jgi:hypothetical protein
MIDWLFRNRETGRITVGQPPNPPMVVFVVATVVRWLTSPEGTAGRVVEVTATAALTIWAVDEVVRGVNPFRRLLGGGVLAYLVRGFVD